MEQTLQIQERPTALSRDMVEALLAEPFEAREVKFKPAVVSGNRAMALAYVDARVIQDRLDEVLGVAGWQDEYEVLPDGSVVCRLRLRLGDEWITKMDVGGPSEQPDEGDRRKAAFSDALEAGGRQVRHRPLPVSAAGAVGGLRPAEAAVRADAEPAAVGLAAPGDGPAASAAGAVGGEQGGNEWPRKAGRPPRQGRLAHRWSGVEPPPHRLRCPPDPAGCMQGRRADRSRPPRREKAGFGSELTAWRGPAILLAVEETKAFEASTVQRAKERKEVA